MNFLKMLARPFIAIWRWIKETAWVQPLLIVGIIFGIIFSIPSITSWVQSWDFGNDDYSWLYKNQLSLKGITDRGEDGEVIDFLESFNDAQSKWNTNDKEGAKTALKSYTKSGKMVLYFVKEDDTCKNINEASNYLVKEAWKENVIDKVAEDKKSTVADFTYQAIFTDQKIDVDDDDHTYDQKTAYEYLLMTGEFHTFYTTVNAAALASNYYKNLSDKSSYQTKVENISSLSNYSSSIPTMILVDLTDTNKTANIITEVIFELKGNDKYTRADFLGDAWAGTEDFKNN